MNNVVCFILGGGKGTRLLPLTAERSKPAVPLGGKYRLIDIPISNCINSGIRRIYLLTQFNGITDQHREKVRALSDELIPAYVAWVESQMYG